MNLLDARYGPSIWRVQKIVIRTLRAELLGHIAIECLKTADARFHRLGGVRWIRTYQYGLPHHAVTIRQTKIAFEITGRL